MKFLINILFLFTCVNTMAQSPKVEFRENKGQWNENVLFKAKIPGGNLYLEQNELTYQFYKEEDMLRLEEMHHHPKKGYLPKDYEFNLHAFKVEFLGAQQNLLKPSFPSITNFNYYIGNDPNKWASNVKMYQEVEYVELYPNINLKFYLKENHLKYDFIVAPNTNVKQIQLKYKGVDQLYLDGKNLHIKTSVNEIIEQKPYAYQIINGVEKEVKCLFKLNNNVLSFVFPKGYNHNVELTIDPILVFASYSGATSDNWGNTSTFDEAENLYGAGVTFGPNYPTTIGAYQTTFNGGNGNYAGTDISISKFSADGSSLIYATFIGGNENESPQSLIVNDNNELIILGSTSSSDYPTTIGAFDVSFNGGTPYAGSIPNFVSGSDIVISKLSASGNNLLASTYVGGSGNDGLSTAPALKYNYADDFRGEILVGSNNDIYVASSTFSIDFPVTAGVFQSTYGGGQDGCVFKMSSDLTTMLWGSYLGGSNDDAAYSLQFDSFGNPHITGGTISNDFPTTVGVLHPNTLGGVDGFITKINTSATAILNSTYIGTDTLEYDQCYFIQLDTANNVYVVGQTEGVYPIFPTTVYNDSNSGQFLHKLSPDLSTTVFSTTFGTNSGEVDIALSAFLVNECNYILISGWGGALNNFYGNATISTTFGLPITPNALQPVTDGNDYYLIMLGENADTLMYGTFFGGQGSLDHVDGGTSRFDKKGIVYQAVCASCGNIDNFPTTPGAWAENIGSSNCNLGVFKFNLTNLVADADVYTTPFHCLGDTVFFENRSNGGYKYTWFFGDGDSTETFEPWHIYDSVGIFNVMLVVLDSVSCVREDTAYIQVFIGGLTEAQIDPISSICNGDSIQLIASGGADYFWLANSNMSNDTTDTITVWPNITTTYTVVVSDSCGIDTTEIEVVVHQQNISICDDTLICLGHSAQLSAIGGGSYVWTPLTTLNNNAIENPIATPDTLTVYTVAVTDTFNCVWDTTVTVFVDTVLPKANASQDLILCLGDTLSLYATGDSLSFLWSPTSTIGSPTDSITSVFPLINTTYTLAASNWCGVDYDTVDVFIAGLTEAQIDPVNAICNGDSIQLIASGGVGYFWLANNNMSNDTTDTITVWPNITTTYTVVVSDSCGIDTTEIEVVVHQQNISICDDTLICLGHSAQLSAIGGGSYVWTPLTTLNNNAIENPIATPDTLTVYTVAVTDTFNCVWDTTVTVFVDTVLPKANASQDLLLCRGDTLNLYATGNNLSFLWSPTSTVGSPTDSITSVFPLINTTYTLAASNWCGVDYDTVFVGVHPKTSAIVDDTIVCIGGQANLWAEGGVSYLWHSTNNPFITSNAQFSQNIYVPTLFEVDIIEPSGCHGMLSVFVNTVPYPLVDLGEDIMGSWGSSFVLNPVTFNAINYTWMPTDGLSCSNCPNPTVSINSSQTYILSIESSRGCISFDTINIIFDGSIYVPNAFTPDGNGENDVFYAFGEDIIEFEMYIYNRWGEHLFYSKDMNVGWDGTYNDEQVKNDVYVWKIKYRDAIGNDGKIYGKVTLIK